MKKKRNIVYSTDKDFAIDQESDDSVTNDKREDSSTLYLHLQRLPGNRINTVIRGLNSSSNINFISKDLKKKLGVGGSVKNKDIYLQGNHREKLQKILFERGFKIKLSGG